MKPAIEKVLSLVEDDFIEISTDNNLLNDEIGKAKEKWLQKDIAKDIIDVFDRERTGILMEKMKKKSKSWKKGKSFVGQDSFGKIEPSVEVLTKDELNTNIDAEIKFEKKTNNKRTEKTKNSFLWNNFLTLLKQKHNWMILSQK